MSSPAPLRPPRASQPAAPGNPLRQQLDELDSLLERMLSLPVDQPDDDRDPIAGVVAPAAPPQAVPAEEAPLRVLRSPEDEVQPVPPEPDSPPRVEVELPPQPRLVAPPSPADPVPARAVAASREAAAPTPARPRLSLGPLPAEVRGNHEPDGILWRFLVWGNHLFDRGAGRLGPFGRWLRRPTGRTVLGWAGLVLLAAALGWVLLDWFGWTR